MKKKMTVAELFKIFVDHYNDPDLQGTFNEISFSDEIGGASFSFIHPKNKDHPQYSLIEQSFKSLVNRINCFYDSK